MKVRVIQSYNGWWNIETKPWYMPVWRYVASRHSFDAAMEMADKLKNPTIVEVQKTGVKQCN